MKTKMKFLVLCLTFFCLIYLIPIDSHAAAVRGVTADTIKLGLIVPLTGPTAFHGRMAADGCINYFKWVNDQGGIHGRKIEIITEDGGAVPAKAMLAAQKLVFRDEVFAIPIIWFSEAVLSLEAFIEQNQLITFPGTYSKFVTHPPRKYVFSTGPYLEDEARVGIDYVMRDLKMKIQKIGMISLPGVSGKSYLDGAKQQAKKYNLEIVGYHEIPTDSIDYSAPILNLRKENADLVMLYLVPPPANLALREAQKLLWRPLFLGAWPSSQDKVVELAGEAAEGMYATRGFALPSYEGVPGLERVREVLKKYPIGKPIEVIPDNYTFSWVNAMVLTEGLKRAGKDLTPDKVVKALEGLKDFPTGDICGPVTYGQNQRGSGARIHIIKADVKNKRFVPVTGWRSPEE